MARVSISSSKGPFCVQKYAFLAFSPKAPGAKFFRQLIPKGLAQTFPTVYETPMMYFFHLVSLLPRCDFGGAC